MPTSPIVLRPFPGEVLETLPPPPPDPSRPSPLRRLPGEPTDEERLGPLPGFRRGPLPIVLRRIPGEPSDEELLGPLPGFRRDPPKLVLKRIPGEPTDEELLGPLPVRSPLPRAPSKLVLKRIPGEPSDEELLGLLPPPTPRPPPPKPVLKRIPGEPSDEELLGPLPGYRRGPAPLVFKRIPGEPSDEELLGPLPAGRGATLATDAYLPRASTRSIAAPARALPRGLADPLRFAELLRPREVGEESRVPGYTALDDALRSPTNLARARWERDNGPLIGYPMRTREGGLPGIGPGFPRCMSPIPQNAPSVLATQVPGVGISGRELLATGRLEPPDMQSPNDTLLLVGGDLDGWVKDGWIGLVAREGDPTLDPLAHAAQVVEPPGPVMNNTRRLTIRFDGGRGSVAPELYAQAKLSIAPDDGRALQALIDQEVPKHRPGPLIVELPAGTYLFGVPYWTRNRPVIVPSQVALRGAGSDLTRLKLAREVNQRVPRDNNQVLEHKFASFFFNQRHISLNLDLQAAYFAQKDPLKVPAPDRDLEFSGMTLDGNKEGQSAFWTGGGNAALWVDSGAGPNSLSSDLIAAPKVTPTHLFCVTLVRRGSNSESTPSNVVTLAVPKNMNTAKLTLLAPPSNPADWQVVVYQREYKGKADEDPKETWPKRPTFGRSIAVKDFGKLGDLGAFSLLPGAAGQYTFFDAKYEDRLGRYGKQPAGLGERAPTVRGQGTGIHLHNVQNVVLRDLRIVDCAGSGIHPTADVAPGRVEDLCAENVFILGCGWYGLGVAGEGRHWEFHNCSIRFNHGGMDFEPTDSLSRRVKQGPLGTTYYLFDVRFEDTNIEENGGVGVLIQPCWDGTIDQLEFVRCVLRGHSLHFYLNRQSADARERLSPPLPAVYKLLLDDCDLIDSAVTAIRIQVPFASGTIRNSRLIRSGVPALDPRFFEPKSMISPAIETLNLGNLDQRDWEIHDNHLFPTLPPGNIAPANLRGAIEIAPLAARHAYRIHNNCLIAERPGKPSIFLRVWYEKEEKKPWDPKPWNTQVGNGQIKVQQNCGAKDDFEVHHVFNEDALTGAIRDAGLMTPDQTVACVCAVPQEVLPPPFNPLPRDVLSPPFRSVVDGDAATTPAAIVVPGVGDGVEVGPIVLVDPLRPPRGDPFPRQWLPNWIDLPPAIRMRSRW